MKSRLMQTLLAQHAHAPDLLPIVSLADYFEGNTDEECIAPNQYGYGRPSLAELYAAFRRIEARPDVQCVLVGLHQDWDETEERSDAWPAAENIHIYTTATAEEAKRWIEGMEADGVIEGWPYGQHPDAPPLTPGHRVLTVCWD